jgi:hypothetical protein
VFNACIPKRQRFGCYGATFSSRLDSVYTAQCMTMDQDRQGLEGIWVGEESRQTHPEQKSIRVLSGMAGCFEAQKKARLVS